MKTLKYLSIFTYLLILSSCQNETIDSEDQVIDSSGIELVDESYAGDIEIFKNTKIMFGIKEHNITEVLTDPTLFSYYENAHAHYLVETDDTSVLHVSSQDVKSGEEMVARIDKKSKLEFETLKRTSKNAKQVYRFLTRTHKDTAFKGAHWNWNRSGLARSNDVNAIKRNINLPNWISNKGSSFSYNVAIQNIRSSKLQLHKNKNMKGGVTTISGHGSGNMHRLQNQNVGDNNLESISFRVTTQ